MTKEATATDVVIVNVTTSFQVCGLEMAVMLPHNFFLEHTSYCIAFYHLFQPYYGGPARSMDINLTFFITHIYLSILLYYLLKISYIETEDLTYAAIFLMFNGASKCVGAVAHLCFTRCFKSGYTVT